MSINAEPIAESALPPTHAPEASVGPQDAPAAPPTGERVRRTPEQRMAAALGKMVPTEEAAETPEPAVEAEPAAPAPVAAKAAVAEAVDDSKQRLAKALADLQKAEENGLSTRKQLEALSQAKADHEQLLADAKANPLAALKKLGLSYNDITQKILKGELKAPDELDERLEPMSKIEKELAELKAERDAEKAEKAYTRDLDTVSSHVTKRADAYPVASSLPSIKTMLLEACYGRKTSDFDSVLAEYEEVATADTRAILSNPAAVKALLKDSKIRETLGAHFGAQPSRKAPASSEGPRALGNDTVSVPTTPKAPALSQADRMKAAVQRLVQGNQ